MKTLPKIIPVFPLPDLVFFPKTYLPLHIFEPRYRQMTRDALEGDRLIGMALLKDGWEPEYEGNPPIYRVGCVGQVIHAQLLGDGRYNIVLYGLMRFVVHEEFRDRPYRQAWISPVSASGPVEPRLLEELLRLLRTYGNQIGLDRPLSMFLKVHLDPEVLVNLFSSELTFTSVEKQFLLESETLNQQCRRLAELLQFKLLERRPAFEDAPPGPAGPSLPQ